MTQVRGRDRVKIWVRVRFSVGVRVSRYKGYEESASRFALTHIRVGVSVGVRVEEQG